MKHWISTLFGGTKVVPWAPPQPDGPLQVVGDVHGCAALLDRLLGKLDQSIPLVLVGDLFDRGDESQPVLDLVRDLPNFWQSDVSVLAGNHEEMMLNFLADPVDTGASWLRHGGLQTLASFGVSYTPGRGNGVALTAARDELREALGEEAIEWVKGLSTRFGSGDVFVVHAGADPAEPMCLQPRRTLLWGHPEFATTPREDRKWVCHGHTIVGEPYARNGRIAIDTGAYATGILTSAVITPDELRFVST